MGIFKKVKSVASSAKNVIKSVPVARGTQVVKGALAAKAAVKALSKGDLGKAQAKGAAGLKGLLGDKAYYAAGSKVKNALGEKGLKTLNRIDKTTVAAASAANSVRKGDFRGAKNNLGDAITIGVGKNNLRKAMHKGQDVIGKKNYNAIHKYGNRTLNVGLDALSAASAIERGDYGAAAGYGSNALRTAVGAKKLHEGKRAIRDKIGQKNYDLLNNSYKAAQLGHDLGKTAADFSMAKDAQKYLKMAKEAKKLHGQAKDAHTFFQGVHAQAQAKNIPVGHPSIVAGEPTQGRPMVQVPTGAIGGSSMKPR
jgi:hypothetical protein